MKDPKYLKARKTRFEIPKGRFRYEDLGIHEGS
jgi:hypothetical protein